MSFEVTIILPWKDNDGLDLNTEISGVAGRVLTVAGGFSTMSQSGTWEDDGIVYDDIATRLITIVDTSSDVQALRTIACDAAKAMRQQTIFFQVHEVQVEFLTAVV